MKLLTDLKMIAKLAEERNDENWRFRTFLKNMDMEIEEIDAIVHRHYEEVAGQIDCCACGNCCRDILTTLDDADVSRLATGLGISTDEVVDQYLTRDEDADLTLNGLPCPFLVENRCSVYDHRPEACRSYPHLHKEEFVFRLMQAVSNCSVCPISFNVYERLKEELWHRPDDIWEEEW
jgi:hypothetical protein